MSTTKLISELYLYPRLDRAAYEKLTGNQAKPFDPSQPVKAWTASVQATTDFLVVGRDGPISLTLTPDQARAVNLPGHYRTDPIINQQYPGATSEIDAMEFAALLGGTAHWVNAVGTAANARWLVITVGDKTIPASLLVRQWYDLGRNNPGKFRLQDGAIFLDAAPPPIEQPLAGAPAEVPFPIRPLKPGERIVHTFGGSVEVVSDDIAGPVGAAGGYTDSDRARDNENSKKLDQILDIFGSTK